MKQVTRRGFVQLGSGAFIASGILNPKYKSDHSTSTPADSDPARSPGKIALEEHFDFAGTEKTSYGSFGGPEFQGQIKELGSGRIAEMDRGGVDVCIVSLVGPGIQAIPNPNQAVDVA